VRGLGIVALLVCGSAHAQSHINDFGVTTETTQYSISKGSTVSYAPGYFGGEATGPYTITGSFTATVSTYWWNYFLDGDPSGTQGTFRYEASTIQFDKPVLNGTVAPDGFVFPSFAVALNNTHFAGSEGDVCSLPMAPNTYCSGVSTPGAASFSGDISGNQIVISGNAPVGSDYSGFNYEIQAAAVPEPSVLLSLTLGLAVLGLVARTRRRPT
jgi:hypothetical protein